VWFSYANNSGFIPDAMIKSIFPGGECQTFFGARRSSHSGQRVQGAPKGPPVIGWQFALGLPFLLATLAIYPADFIKQ
jgi:hypothetical protein